MSYKAVTLNLESANLLWLKDQAVLAGRQTLNEALNEILAKLRGSGQNEPRSFPSVRGTIEIAEDDPNLDGADDALRAYFADSHESDPG